MNTIETFAPTESIRAREFLALSQARVARDTGINRSYLSQYESGKRILEDRWKLALKDYYVSLGWDPHLDPEDLIEPERELEPPFNLVSRDGFEIALSDMEAVEILLEEFYESGDQLELLEQVPIERGFFGELEAADALWQCRQYLAHTARQVEILRSLRGHSKLTEEAASNAADISKIKTVGDYVAHLTRPLRDRGLATSSSV